MSMHFTRDTAFFTHCMPAEALLGLRFGLDESRRLSVHPKMPL